MILSLIMRVENILIFFCIMFIFVVACTSMDNVNTTDSCIIFNEKKNWYKSTKNSQKKWGTPISLQLSIINQESGFNQFAKPKRKFYLGLFPGSRPSTAFGYAQVTNPTWDWYKTSTGNFNASRANFDDITDFIGWYTTQSKKILNIPMNDFYNHYLAYHEGQGGWKNKSYNSKKWLLKAAKNVESKANKYNNQLRECEARLNKKGFLGLF